LCLATKLLFKIVSHYMQRAYAVAEPVRAINTEHQTAFSPKELAPNVSSIDVPEGGELVEDHR
jgi:hypothetical protein